MPTQRASIVVSLLLAVSCTRSEMVIDYPSCGERGTELRVAANVETAQGTADALAQRTAGEQTAMFRYWRSERGKSLSTSTTATVSVTPEPDSARLVQRKDHTDKQLACEPSLEMDVDVRIASEDGSFDEQLRGTLVLYGQELTLSAELRFADRQGSYTTDGPFAKGVLRAHMWPESNLLGAPDPVLWTGSLTLDDPTRKDGASAEVAAW
jgi:hypothetical protein